MEYQFEWDVFKAASNRKKHNVSFEIAATIFKDPLTITIFDSKHSDVEDRWITMGLAGNKSILVVVHTYKDIDYDHAIIRLISARKATKNEIRQYQGWVS